MSIRIRSSIALLGAAATVAALAGCTASDSPSVDVVYQDTATGQCASDPADGVDLAAAQAIVAPFLEPAKSILATEPLAEPIEQGLTAVYLNNGTPVAQLFSENLAAASAAAGIEYVNVDTGADAQSINAAMNSVVEMRPDIVFDQSIDAIFFQDQLQQLKDQGATIVYGGQLNAEEFGLVDSLGGLGSIDVNADVLAASAITLTCGTATEFVIYSPPEFPSSPLMIERIQERIGELCADCAVRVVDISVTDASPADKIVSDLQANPDTHFLIALVDQFQLGLADKAALAGIENARGIGVSSLPQNFQQIADGLQTAGYAADFGIFMWLQVDEALRRSQGMDVPYLDDMAVAGQTISRLITLQNVEGVLGPEGFVSVADYQDQFRALWGVG